LETQDGPERGQGCESDIAYLKQTEKRGHGIKTTALIDSISALVKLLERIDALESKRRDVQRQATQPRLVDNARRLELARRLDALRRQLESEGKLEKGKEGEAEAA
jgi:hypothetical protein